MKNRNRFSIKSKIKRLAVILFSFFLAAVLVPAAGVQAENGRKTVRVGWYETPFNHIDEYGRRSGYAYEYQRKIAAYTGWEYEYVTGSWHELMEMLEAGEIDLMSDVSYKEERTERMLYASLPMGTESYYVFICPDNQSIQSDNYTTLNGKRVGIMKSSIQEDQFLTWEKMHQVSAEVVEVTCSEEESIEMLAEGKLDAFVTMDFYGDPERAVPVCKIGSSDFYFAVNKERPELLAELDAAMSRIQDENQYYNEQLHAKYFSNSSTERYFTAEELDWLDSHDAIRVGYQDHYLAFCAADETGNLTGALKDFLVYASEAMENADVRFETFCYPTAAAAMEALANGEIDCMFPANLTDYDSETAGVVMSPAIMRTEMDAVVRASAQKEFLRKETVNVAVNEGNTNYDMFLADHYPGWNRIYFKDTPSGLDAVAAGEADCVIISNYRFSNISKQCEKLHLMPVYTGVDMDYCFALRTGDSTLYSVLSRVIIAVPESVINASLTYYSTEDVKMSFPDLVREHLLLVMTVISGILLVILILLLRYIKAEKKVMEEEHKVKDLNRKVFVDALTSVRNKAAFYEYIESLQEQVDNGEQMNFAIGIFDCDDLKQINDQNGHDKGDVYLKTASQLICRIFAHSPVFRIGGDEFAVILQKDDFANREELARTFDQAQKEVSAAAGNEWEEVQVTLGIAVYNPEIDHSVTDTFRRADKIMYENKRIRKENTKE